jgi:hypothetical protein
MLRDCLNESVGYFQAIKKKQLHKSISIQKIDNTCFNSKKPILRFAAKMSDNVYGKCFLRDSKLPVSTLLIKNILIY